jgi:hypothetical protein
VVRWVDRNLIAEIAQVLGPKLISGIPSIQDLLM